MRANLSDCDVREWVVGHFGCGCGLVALSGLHGLNGECRYGWSSTGHRGQPCGAVHLIQARHRGCTVAVARMLERRDTTVHLTAAASHHAIAAILRIEHLRLLLLMLL